MSPNIQDIFCNHIFADIYIHLDIYIYVTRCAYVVSGGKGSGNSPEMA